MKRLLKKWMLRLTATGLLITALLLIIVLNPGLTYANKTTHNNYAIYHNKALDPAFTVKLDQATELLKSSEIYNPTLHLDICLNDGSKYPKLIRALRGQAFAFGYHNKVVLQGNTNVTGNYVELNGYRWNLIQLLAHEMTHCLQFKKLGFWKSKPIASIPNWKWEGYAEYVSRQNNDQKELTTLITQYNTADKNEWAIYFADGTIAPTEYFGYWILVKYCLDIKRMSYLQLLSDSTDEETIRQEMMSWYHSNKTI